MLLKLTVVLLIGKIPLFAVTQHPFSGTLLKSLLRLRQKLLHHSLENAALLKPLEVADHVLPVSIELFRHSKFLIDELACNMEQVLKSILRFDRSVTLHDGLDLLVASLLVDQPGLEHRIPLLVSEEVMMRGEDDICVV